MTTFYQIKDFEVALFPMKYVKSIFGCTRSGILQKEARGQLPTANWRNAQGQRLYSIEDLGIIEYVYKEVWPFRQGSPTPEWVKDMVTEALAQAKKVMLQYGSAADAGTWDNVHTKYAQFNKYRAQVYVDSWRSRLLGQDKFFEELVDE